MNLAAFCTHLATIDLETTANQALAHEAARIEQAVRASLSTEPGGPHTHPWLQTGHLRDSIAHWADGPTAEIGSTSDIAAYHEHGTAELPPRPTFAPIAAAEGEAVAHTIAQSVVHQLRSR